MWGSPIDIGIPTKNLTSPREGENAPYACLRQPLDLHDLPISLVSEHTHICTYFHLFVRVSISPLHKMKIFPCTNANSHPLSFDIPCFEQADFASNIAIGSPKGSLPKLLVLLTEVPHDTSLVFQMTLICFHG